MNINDKSMKKVVVLIRSSPFNTIKASEAIRLALGLTLSKNQVFVIMLDEGVWNAKDIRPKDIKRPEVSQFLELYSACKIKQMVDSLSLDERNITDIRNDVESIDRQEVLSRLTEADVVIPF